MLSDLLKWLQDIGLSDLKEYFVNTTLDGERLLMTPEDELCSRLNLGMNIFLYFNHS